MPVIELFRLAWAAIVVNRFRSALTTLGIVIGITSVILLTSLGEGMHRFIVSQFSQFGTNFLQVAPGRTMTNGMPNMLSTVRKLTIEDAESLLRVPGVQRVVPATYGLARVEMGDRGRNVFIYGVTADVPDVWKFQIGQGQFLPARDPREPGSVAVLGPRLKRELFGESNALGEHVRIGGRRFRVIGVMAAKGQLMGFDVDDAAYIPVASAQTLFNRAALDEIHALFTAGSSGDAVTEGIRQALMRRQAHEEAFTITTQTDMLSVLDRVLGVINLAVGGIGAISLVVGAVGILTIMWIAVGERTNEIGVMKAIGATGSQVLMLFLIEAALLSTAGGVAGVAVGLGIGWIVRSVVPNAPFATPAVYVGLAIAVSLAVGLMSGVLPARRAASLDPIESLRAE